MTKITYRIENDGCVGEGWVSKQEEGWMISLMTFDGYVDDGFFQTEAEAIVELKKQIAQAKKTAVEFTKLAEASPTGMY